MKTLRSTARSVAGTSALALASMVVGALGLAMLQALPWSPPPPDRAAHYNWEGLASDSHEHTAGTPQ